VSYKRPRPLICECPYDARIATIKLIVMGFPEGVAEPGSEQDSISRRELSSFLGKAVLGSLIPGAGIVAAGRRWGWYVIVGWAGLIAGMAFGAYRLGIDGLIELGTDSDRLRVIAPVLLVFAAVWLAIAVLSFHMLQTDRIPAPYRASGAIAVIAASSLVIAPIVLTARNIDTQGDLIERVFASPEDRSLTSPEDAGTVDDPWAGRPRLNILLLGSDAGRGRDGVRPDTIILASIDTRSGDAILFSLPRNLQRVPFADDSPLAELYPNGFTGYGDPNEYLLNAVYGNVPALHPDIFEGATFPGADAMKWAVEGALGLDVHYFVMVNLEGFERMVDALGGVTIDVYYRVPIGTKVSQVSGTCTEPLGWIEPGLNQRLDGFHALWFARARCGPPPVTDDYNRMERQRCVIGAIAEQVNPRTVLQNYQRIAGATEDLILTDIPQDLLRAFVDLGREVQDGKISSLAFTDDILVPSNPDYENVHELTNEALSKSRKTGDNGGGKDRDDGLPVDVRTPDDVAGDGESGVESLTSVC
jgi:LCP family protein required for cell wall assembly